MQFAIEQQHINRRQKAPKRAAKTGVGFAVSTLAAITVGMFLSQDSLASNNQSVTDDGDASVDALGVARMALHSSSPIDVARGVLDQYDDYSLADIARAAFADGQSGGHYDLEFIASAREAINNIHNMGDGPQTVDHEFHHLTDSIGTYIDLIDTPPIYAEPELNDFDDLTLNTTLTQAADMEIHSVYASSSAAGVLLEAASSPVIDVVGIQWPNQMSILDSDEMSFS